MHLNQPMESELFLFYQMMLSHFSHVVNTYLIISIFGLFQVSAEFYIMLLEISCSIDRSFFYSLIFLDSFFAQETINFLEMHG